MEHRPVLLAEVLDFLAGGKVRVLLDATLGLGGHASGFLEANDEARASACLSDAIIRTLYAIHQARQISADANIWTWANLDFG